MTATRTRRRPAAALLAACAALRAATAAGQVRRAVAPALQAQPRASSQPPPPHPPIKTTFNFIWAGSAALRRLSPAVLLAPPCSGLRGHETLAEKEAAPPPVRAPLAAPATMRAQVHGSTPRRVIGCARVGAGRASRASRRGRRPVFQTRTAYEALGPGAEEGQQRSDPPARALRVARAAPWGAPCTAMGCMSLRGTRGLSQQALLLAWRRQRHATPAGMRRLRASLFGFEADDPRHDPV